MAKSEDPDQTALYEQSDLVCTICLDVSVILQSNFNGSNTYGTLKISLRQG